MALFGAANHSPLCTKAPAVQFLNSWIDGWMDGWIDEWFNEWMDEWINGSMNE